MYPGKFLSQKTKLTIKQHQEKLLLKCIEHEKHFRLHLLWNLKRQSTQAVYDPKLYNILIRQYPCDCLMHRLHNRQTNNNMLHENRVAIEVDEFCQENNLFDRSNRFELLNLYNFISSAFFTFQDLTEKYHLKHLDQYIEWCRKISMMNFSLHQQLSKESIDYDQIKIHHLPPRPIPRELLRTQNIVDSQVLIGIKRQGDVISRCILPQTRELADKCNEAPRLKNHIIEAVHSHMPNSSYHCITSDQMRLERALLMEQAENLDNEEIDDLSTLLHNFEEIDNKYKKLLEKKKTLQSQIEKKKHDYISLTKLGMSKVEEFNMNNTKLETFRNIITKNQKKLNRLVDENNKIKQRLEYIEILQRRKEFDKKIKKNFNS